MKLELKTKEYKMLCNQLEKLKQEVTNPNDEKLLELKQLFQKNHEEIVEINSQLRKIKENEEKQEIEMQEKYSADNIFKKREIAEESKNTELIVKKQKESIFNKIEKILKKILKV